MNTTALKNLWKFTVFASLMLLAIFVVENINHRFWLNDFKVYYLAAKAWLAGEQVYGIPFGLSSGLYKYSPFTLFFVFPYTVFPFEIADIIHFFVLAFVIVYVFYVIRRILRDYLVTKLPENLNLLFSFAFVCVLIHFVKELHLGNINVVLLLLSCLSLEAMLKSRHILSGVLFGLVVLTKPFFLILILPLIFRKKWRVLAGFSGILVLSFVLPVIFFGFSESVFLYKEWVRNLFAHQSDYPAHNSIQYLIQHFIYPGVPNQFQYVIIAFGGMVFLVMHYFNRKTEMQHENPERLQNIGLIIEWFTLIAILPNLVKTDSEHFLCSLPMIVMIIFYLASEKKILPVVFFILLIFFYGGNSTDLLGTDLSDRLFNMGLIGISNMFLVGFAVVVFYRTRGQITQP